MNTKRRHSGYVTAFSNNPVFNDYNSYHIISLQYGSFYTNHRHIGSLNACFNNPGSKDSISYHTNS
jgi:hypothetical protein